MGILDDVRLLGTVAKNLASIEEKQKLIELQVQMTEQYASNVALRSENEELKRKLEFQGKLTLSDNCLWDGEPDKSTAYCPSCWSVSSKAVPLTLSPHKPRMYRHCPNCKERFDSIKHKDTGGSSPGFAPLMPGQNPKDLW